MYYDLEKKIDDYSAELFADLGLSALSEEAKADLYARVENHLHQALISFLQPVLGSSKLAKIKQAIDQEDYHALDESLAAHPQYKSDLEAKIDEEFKKLKLIIGEEQQHAGTRTDTAK